MDEHVERNPGASDRTDSGPRCVVVGGGITGLAAAHRLKELDAGIRVTVLESGERPGGVLETIERDGFLIETSADSFLTSLPGAMDLCRRLGLEERIIPTDPTHRRAFVVRRGRLLPIPDGLIIMAPSRIRPMLTTPILSPVGKARMAWERFVPRGDGRDESLASFVRRRFGVEAFDRLIQPMVSGMYTGDPERLSVRATLPRFLDMEQQHGSLIRATRRSAQGAGRGQAAGSGARYGLFAGLRGGMSDLVRALERRLPAGTLRCGARVESIRSEAGGRWRLQLAGGEAISAEAVLVATPARLAAGLLGNVDEALSQRLGEIPVSSTAIASLGYRRDRIDHPMDGFGFVVPSIEGLPILSGSFSSVKFPGRAPEGHALIRVFLGGARRPELLEQDDDALIRMAHEALVRLLGIRGAPLLRHLTRWQGAMPQYEVGHLDRIAAIEARIDALPGLELAGNAYRGVGVPQCIQGGEDAAGRLAAYLQRGFHSASEPMASTHLRSGS